MFIFQIISFYCLFTDINLFSAASPETLQPGHKAPYSPSGVARRVWTPSHIAMFSERYLLNRHWNQLRGWCHAHKPLELSGQNPITGYASRPFSCVVLRRQRYFTLSNFNMPKTKKM